MRSMVLGALAVSVACQHADQPGVSHPVSGGRQTSPGEPAGAPPPGAHAASPRPRAPRFEVPPLPPGSPIPRWQQFCWAGGDALTHLNEAGAQGWELVSVSIATTSDVAAPRSTFTPFTGKTIESVILPGTQTWLVCFKRPLPPPTP